MTSPLDFVGRPDWRSAVLAVLFAAPWLVLLARKRLARFWTWVALIAGIVLFPISIAWVQVPIQQAINRLYLNSLPVETINRYLLLLGIPLILVSGLVQEVFKFAIGVIGLSLSRERHVARAGLAMGAAAGAGYGGMEAFWVFNTIFAAGFTWGTVELGGVAALLGFIERFFTVMFHTSVAAISTYGYATGRPWRYLLLAIGLHSGVNYFALLLQAGVITADGTEVVIGVIAVLVLAGALWLRAHAKPAPPNVSGPPAA